MANSENPEPESTEPPTGPLAETPARSAPAARVWTLPIVLAIAVGAALIVASTVLILVPFAQSVPESFSIADPGSSTLNYVYNITFYHGGSFGFIWNTNNSQVLTFTITGPSDAKVYSATSSDGLGNITILAGGEYSFAVHDSNPSTVTVSGTYSFRAPYLQFP